MRCYHVKNLPIFCDSLNAFLRSMQSVNCLLKNAKQTEDLTALFSKCVYWMLERN